VSTPKKPAPGSADGGYRGSGDWRSAAERAEVEVRALRDLSEEGERLRTAEAEIRSLRRQIWERDHAEALEFMRGTDEARQKVPAGRRATLTNVAAEMGKSESAWKRDRSKLGLDGWRPGMSEDWTPSDR
jgi:hypothetical protein